MDQKPTQTGQDTLLNVIVILYDSNTILTAWCYAERGIAAASRLSVCLSVTLRYRDHIGWDSSTIILPLVSVGRSLFADPNVMYLLQREHPKILIKSYPPPVELSIADIRWQMRPNGCEIAQWSMGSVWKPPSLFPMVRSMTRSNLPFPQNVGPKCIPRDMSNFEWLYIRNGSSDPLHVSF